MLLSIITQDTWAYEHNIPLNKGTEWKDHCFIDEGDSNEWAGAVRWFRGSLQIVHGSPEFPPGRELLFYHRAQKNLVVLSQDIIDDMLTYGYLLPSWIPLVSHQICMPTLQKGKANSVLHYIVDYIPFKAECKTDLK